MTEWLDSIETSLRGVRFQFADEAQLQEAIARLLPDFEREVVLAGGRVDFMDGEGIVLEVKVQRIGDMALLRQLKRYADCAEVSAIVVVTLFPVDIPRELAGKPLRVVELWRAGL